MKHIQKKHFSVNDVVLETKLQSNVQPHVFWKCRQIKRARYALGAFDGFSWQSRQGRQWQEPRELAGSDTSTGGLAARCQPPGRLPHPLVPTPHPFPLPHFLALS